MLYHFGAFNQTTYGIEGETTQKLPLFHTISSFRSNVGKKGWLRYGRAL